MDHRIMDSSTRPDPDTLLRAVMREEEASVRGRLKLFFGMAPGVGKTYAMLEAAREQLREGVDVVAGCVETHGREETARLIVGLPSIPKKRLQYRGIALEEMDIDAILVRRPKIVLVDELAHTNAPGSRHEKRWQDILELLTEGIDVYSTLNVQHLESRMEAVREITGVAVRERVPDSVLDMADDIELIDLEPDTLLRRLAEGKVYLGGMAETATAHFFRTENLIALREMALRLAADRVDRQLRQFVQVNRMEGAWKATHRLLVAVGPSPLSASLVRWACALASTLEAPWMAVCVQHPDRLRDPDRENIERNLSLARQLGAEIQVTTDVDLVQGLLRVARQNNITQIVVGKTAASGWRRLTGMSLVDRLIRESGTIDIHAVRVDERTGASKRLPGFLRLSSRPADYAVSVGAIGAVLLACFVALPLIGYWTVALLLLLVIFSLSVFVGRGPVLLAAAVSALVWDYFFIPPAMTLFISRIEDIVMFLMYFVVALVVGFLASRTRAQERASRMRENQIASFYAFTRDTADAADEEAVAQHAIALLARQFSADIAVLLSAPDGGLVAVHANTFALTDHEHVIAQWSLRNGLPAGNGTGTLQSTPAVFTPLLAPGGAVGVIVLRRADGTPLMLEERLFFDTFIGQVSAGIERKRLESQARASLLLRESERLQRTLLNSVSHELRTPLAALSSAATALTDGAAARNEALRTELALEVRAASERLDRVVENLLDISRLESGRLVLKWEWTEVADLIGVALRNLRAQATGRDVRVRLDGPLPLLRADIVLLEQALVNVLHNAVSHTPPDTAVRIEARQEGGAVFIDVTDNGPGFPEESLPYLFDKFYRAPGTAAGGIGLGLSIARGLVEAHGGSMEASNPPAGGARVTMRLPVPATPSMPEEEE
jgi:two-component system, OmpR family, sensor histidine kinase KdpD